MFTQKLDPNEAWTHVKMRTPVSEALQSLRGTRLDDSKKETAGDVCYRLIKAYEFYHKDMVAKIYVLPGEEPPNSELYWQYFTTITPEVREQDMADYEKKIAKHIKSMEISKKID